MKTQVRKEARFGHCQVCKRLMRVRKADDMVGTHNQPVHTRLLCDGRNKPPIEDVPLTGEDLFKIIYDANRESPGNVHMIARRLVERVSPRLSHLELENARLKRELARLGGKE